MTHSEINVAETTNNWASFSSSTAGDPFPSQEIGIRKKKLLRTMWLNVLSKREKDLESGKIGY